MAIALEENSCAECFATCPQHKCLRLIHVSQDFRGDKDLRASTVSQAHPAALTSPIELS